ncbi:hypothetical protein SCA03_62300 [Streptomyces cacaoi]|uniref:Uncharacterized protein n=1 Tax=Streptomyces cacaoi TaxID=1898 RepID=A0A4Y3R8J2_STRCI|nr:hypothetical protein SCA03_62300 [Streptomyces cacaoi]
MAVGVAMESDSFCTTREEIREEGSTRLPGESCTRGDPREGRELPSAVAGTAGAPGVACAGTGVTSAERSIERGRSASYKDRSRERFCLAN